MKKKTVTNSESPDVEHWWQERPLPEIPEFEYLGHREVRTAVRLPVHRHSHSFEFVCIERGRVAWSVEGVSYETGAGEVFHTRPNEVHGGLYDVMEPCSIWWFQLRVPVESTGQVGAAAPADPVDIELAASVGPTERAGRGSPGSDPRSSRLAGIDPESVPEWGGVPDPPMDRDRPWLGLLEEEGKALAAGLWSLPRVVRAGPAVVDRLREIRSTAGRTGALSTLLRRTALVDILVRLVRESEPEKEASPGDREAAAIQNVIRSLSDAPPRRVSVAELARQAHMSVSYFHALFRRQTGMSPRAYVERLVIRSACRELETTSKPVTEIAHDLGYATSQHFARAFRKVTGYSPTEWRQRA